MKFKLMKNDGDDIYSHNEQPFKAAYCTTETKTEQYKPTGETWTWKAVLEYDEKEQPQAVMKKIVTPAKPENWWYHRGQNHQQIDKVNNIWQREVVETSWYIDFETLEELEEFCKDDYREVSFNTNGNIITFW